MWTAAHPRSRGENVLAAPMIVLIWGSSPLMRGKRGQVGGDANQVGLIPAHAGKTARAAFPAAISPAHPCSRGENFSQTSRASPWLGSSPLMRGKHRRHPRTPRQRRLIPTHAGKTEAAPTWTSCERAHPHSRGENYMPTLKAMVDGGSSPLMRGKHFLTYTFFAQIGQTLESPELCVSSESYSSREPVPPATSRNATVVSRARSSAPHSLQPIRWSIRSPRGQTPPSE